jgi:glycosyltransferase involved in cell wall biosynthesis
MPPGSLPSKAVSVGYLPGNTDQLAKARAQLFNKQPTKKFDVYARFGTWTDSQPIRQTIVENLANSSIDFVGGFEKRLYPAYLKELMQARIAVDAAGQGPISYRLVEAMALATLVVCSKPDCAFPEELREGVHYLAIKEDGSNVVEVCQNILQCPDKLRQIVRHAMGYFDNNFSPQGLARRILRAATATISQ